MSTEDLPEIRALSLEDAEKGMRRMRDYLGHFPTTGEWKEHKEELNITTGPSDVGGNSEYTFAEIRGRMGGILGKHPDEVEDRRRLPIGVEMELNFENDVDYNPDADKYIYVLKLISADEESYYYVGQTIDLYGRLKAHMAENGDSMEVNSIIDEVDRIGVVDVESHSAFLEESGEFKQRIKTRERRKTFEVAKEYNTSKVLGGR